MADSSQLILLLALEHWNMDDFATNPNKDLRRLEKFVVESKRGWRRELNLAIERYAENEDGNE